MLNQLSESRQFTEFDLCNQIARIKHQLNIKNDGIEKPIRCGKGLKQSVEPSQVTYITSRLNQSIVHLIDGSAVHVSKTSFKLSAYSPFFRKIRLGFVINMRHKERFTFIPKKIEKQDAQARHQRVPRAFLEINGELIEISGDAVKETKELLNA